VTGESRRPNRLAPGQGGPRGEPVPEITPERTAWACGYAGPGLARDARAQALAQTAEPALRGAELDATIESLAQRFPEPQGPQPWGWTLYPEDVTDPAWGRVTQDTGHEASYYRENYGRYSPDWVPLSAGSWQNGALLAAWDRYYTSQPGSDEHKRAYADMHRETNGRGFPGPDPDQSYLADHGYADRLRRFERFQQFERWQMPGIEPDDAPLLPGGWGEPADAVPRDGWGAAAPQESGPEPGPDAARWTPAMAEPDLYGAPECDEADPEMAHFGMDSPGVQDRRRGLSEHLVVLWVNEQLRDQVRNDVAPAQEPQGHGQRHLGHTPEPPVEREAEP
jgi:hypothetical protein